MKNWFTYILKCNDGSLYVGMTDDVKRRFDEHRGGRGGRYTRSHIPEEILFFEKCDSKTGALKREHQIKGWAHDKKLKFIKNQNKPG